MTEEPMTEGPKLAARATTFHHGVRFPNESAEYRQARNELLRQEIKLRRQIERVAEQRRALPPGGKLKEDYLFNQGSDRPLRFSELFGDKPTLVTYSLMFGAERPRPCPSCSALLDGLDGSSRHIEQRANFVVIAGSPLDRIKAAARERGWRHLRFASSFGTTFNRDYFAEDIDGGEWPALNVFRKDGNAVHHTYASEMLFTKPDPGQHSRHNGPIDQLWNMFDFTPDGRGADWGPKLDYETSRHAA
jgi:predicted dithiol-disulfide oxidoreductase (DUF899 family)